MANTVINTPELLNLDSTTGATILAKGTISERPSIPTFNADYLIIAGGGGGGGGRGGNATVWSAGGGGGGYQYSTGIKLLIDTNYTITVGAGGAGGTGNGTPISSDGENSSIVASGIINEVATGGIGGGKSQGGAGGASGSLPSNSGGTSYSAGAYWGAGGGAGIGSNGSNGSSSSGGAGGNGLQFSITGTATYYSGGGGGGIYQLNNGGSGGLGGGGNGKGTTANGDNGLVNTGGGGGGAGSTGASAGVNFTGGTGGSGIVILRYPNSYTINIGAGLTSSTITDGSEKVTSFTSGTGTITFTDSTSTNPDEYPINGTLRFNTDTNKTEYYDGTGWYEIVDEYANGYDGIPTNYFDTKLYTGNGATQSIGGYINGAGSFNGSSSKITAPPLLSSSYAGSVSYSAWFKTSNTANTIKTIIVTDDTTGGISGKVLLLAVSYSGGTSGLLELTGYNFPTFSSFGTTNVADGNWHNAVVVLDNPNATLKVYLDGNYSSPEITKTLSSSNITLDKVFSEDWTIGSQGTIRFFDGSIDQVRIYNTALSSADVTALYGETAATATTAAFPSGQTAIATYTMDTSANGLLNTQDLSTVNYPAGAGCLALYEMNGNSNDTSGTYNGTPTNITYEGGAFDQAAIFNGSSSYIAIGSPIPNTDTNVAISAWVKLSGGISSNMHITGTGITSAGSEAPFRATLQYQSANTFRIFALRQVAGTYYLAANSTLTDVTINADTWYHVVWSYNSTGRKLSTFLNGTAIDTDVSMSTSGSSVNDSSTVIGSFRSTSGPFFDGSIDQVRIFNTALTQSQVTTLARGIATSYSGAATNVNFNGHLDFQPDFIWIKNRDNAYNHYLYDSIRGPKNVLISDSTIQNTVQTNGLSSFEANGFFLEGNRLNVNENNSDIVAWNWKAGGTAVTNNDGTIASQVSANKDSGFSIVTMNNASVSTVGHGLSQAPELIIWKSLTSNTNYWQVLAQAANGGNGHLGRLALQRSDAFLTVSSVWNNTQPTSTVFTLGASCTGSGVAYCFHSVAGYSKIGSYTGDGTTSGNIITTGFEPSFLLTKPTGPSGGYWYILDNKRSTTNPRNDALFPNDSLAEISSTNYNVDFLSTGFELKNNTIGYNQNNEKYIYMAFA